jgi:putative drug exporter of the RND superfamily
VGEPVLTGPASRGFAWLVIRLRILIVPAWVAAVILAMDRLPGASSSEGEQIADLVPEDSAAVAAEVESIRLFDFPLLTRIAIVQRDPEGLSAEAQARVFTRAIDLAASRGSRFPQIAAAFPITNTLGLVPGSREDSTTAITFLFFRPDTSFRVQDQIAHRYAAETVNRPGDALAGVTGAIPARIEQTDLILRTRGVVEVATVLLVALIVGITFGSLVAPLVTLFTAGIAYLTSVRVVAWMAGRFGLTLPRDLEPVLVVLVLGIVTDYCIFFFSGMRQRIRAGESRLEAAERTTAEYSPLILTAALIVAGGTAALAVATVGFLRAFGPGLAVTVLVSLAVSITLAPALLGLLGRSLFWPRMSKARRDRERVQTPPVWRTGLARAMTARLVAAPVAVLALGLLIVAAAGLLRMDLGFTLVNGLPASSEVRRAAEAANEGFADGVLAPTLVVLRGAGLAERGEELSALQQRLAEHTGVAAVIGPGTVQTELPEGVALSDGGDAARYVLILTADPLGGDAIDILRSIQARMPRLLVATGLSGVRPLYAGDTALASEAVAQTFEDLARVAVAALVIDLILLIVFLRSLVAPVYLLLTSVLALAASLGVMTFVFQDMLGRGEITYYVPFAAAVLLVALGSDYNVFVVGRIWAEAQRRPLRDAIAVAAPQASRAIAVAGVTLALSFAVLAVVPLVQFREFAFAMLVGILLDSFLVRSLLVPALIAVFGRLSLWPSRRSRVAAAAASSETGPPREGYREAGAAKA